MTGDAGIVGLPSSIQSQMGTLPSADNSAAFLAARGHDEERLVLFRAYPVGPEVEDDTPVEQHALVNPTSFSESWEPQYSKRGVLGLSHEIIQYIRTSSRIISMDLWISWQVFIQKNWVPKEAQEKGALYYRDFFAALTVPCGRRLTPPLVNVDWPRAALSFTGVVESLSFDYERFSAEGEPLEYTIKLKFLEVLSGLMTYSRVFQSGFGQLATEDE